MIPSGLHTERITKRFIGAVEDEWQLYSNNSSDYTTGSPIGFGASSVVYAAEFHPPGGTKRIPCALKVLDLDRLPTHSLHLIQRETQLMSLAKHPNVLRVRGTWTQGHKLYIALRIMNAGSAADVMRYGWAGGMEEEVVKCILKQALEGLNYLHINGLIHRDVKAANLLIDDDGTVLLGDLGVAAFLYENEEPIKTSPTTNFPSGESNKRKMYSPPKSPVLPNSKPPNTNRPRLGKRKSFVGTPCWMAPEIINGKHYDSSADIWSFGITALELTQGRAPRSRESPHSVLLHIVQDPSPQLKRNDGSYKYSRAFAEIVEQCLNKDPSKRPTAQDLLHTNFFKGAKKKSYLVSTILKDLPPLTKRQERKKQPSIVNQTIDSWDFSQSPTVSVYSRPVRSLKPPESVSEVDNEDGSSTELANVTRVSSENREYEEGAAAYAQRMRERHINSQHAPRPHSEGGGHSKSISWANEVEFQEPDNRPRLSGSPSESNGAEDSERPSMPRSGAQETQESVATGDNTGGLEVSDKLKPPEDSSTSAIPIAAAGSPATKHEPDADTDLSSPNSSDTTTTTSPSHSSPHEHAESPSSRLWRKLTKRANGNGEDKANSNLRKAMNGVSGMVKKKQASMATAALRP